MAVKPKLTVNFKERDFGLSKILREAAKLRKKPYVKAGITQARGSKVREDGKKTTAEIAQIHEYGAPEAGIPERSFLRSTREKYQSKYDAHLKKLGDEILDSNSGMTTEKALGLIGQEYARDVKNAIRTGIAPALKESTIRSKNAGVIEKAKGKANALGSKFQAQGKLSKGEIRSFEKASATIQTGGSSVPLIDTAQMINAVSYEVASDGSQESGEDGGTV